MSAMKQTNNGHGSPVGDGLVDTGGAAGSNDSMRPVSEGHSLSAAVEETERLAAGSIPARDRPMSAQTVDVLAPGPYWLTTFRTVSGWVTNGRLPVVVVRGTKGERGRYYDVRLPHGVTSIAKRQHLITRCGVQS